VALVKPQFEVGKEQVGRKGLVRDRGLHRQVLQRIVRFTHQCGASVRGVCPAGLTGATGNQEYFLHTVIGTGAPPASDWQDWIDAAIDAGAAVS